MPNLKQQHQKYTDAEGDPVGDCFRTAIACLLEIPRDEVPHFVDLHKEDHSSAWWYAAVRFTENRLPGWTLVCVRPVYPIYFDGTDNPKRVILSGDSPRGPWLHSVLVSADTGEFDWDPHPEGRGVGFPTDVIALTRQSKLHYAYMNVVNGGNHNG